MPGGYRSRADLHLPWTCLDACHSETVSKVDLSSRPFKIWAEGKEDQQPVLTQSLIIATGATAKRMHIPGEDKYWQSGISACAVCDGTADHWGQRSRRLSTAC